MQNKVDYLIAAKVVIDDGRRYLARTEKKFDVITIDPPPPMAAAGSSLLYSVEMYTIIKKRLKENGVVQQWIPGDEPVTIQAAARSIAISFPYIRVYHSIEGWGYHILASMKPFRKLTASEMVSRLPENARKDLLTWCTDSTIEEYVQRMLSGAVPPDSLLTKEAGPSITDARPCNEYFLLRQLFGGSRSALFQKARKIFTTAL